MFKLPIERDGNSEHMGPLTGVYLEILSNRWQDIEFLFIDEIFMVPYKMLYNIDIRLRQLKNNLDEPFREINVIVFDDLMQLPPVRGLQVFQKKPQPTSSAPFMAIIRFSRVNAEHATTRRHIIC
ncbi:ATP-dependent DNA helicase [Nephila pilipes]|uniref:ATP-dependent DNA helicase n=1 Tax=Nephila pilipes TaxID=299642 RepID=A0A8X6PRM3_NEPPI|nr:ATP-dependent DNA helicase [Nephila pilipes]GFT78023.1 ATP-dependent DNA helicase [Nephila pilipes]GFT92394.1 ATP-dependent DNA helicase [Nephila pilipes]GFU46273.1 ATP-dependent DNA helicase [Nephila pilipes]